MKLLLIGRLQHAGDMSYTQKYMCSQGTARRFKREKNRPRFNSFYEMQFKKKAFNELRDTYFYFSVLYPS